MEGKGNAVAVPGGSCASPVCRQGAGRPLLVIFLVFYFLFFWQLYYCMSKRKEKGILYVVPKKYFYKKDFT